MQSIFKGRFQNWQKKLSKDKNKKSWLCVSRELITPCWFWAEDRRLGMVSSHGVKGGSCLHSLVMISSLAEPGEDSLWDWNGRKGMSPAQITWRGWTHCLPWMILNCLAPCCLQTPPPPSSLSLPFPFTSHSDICACFCLPASLCSHSQERCSESPCHSARWNLEVAQDISECSSYMSIIWWYRKQLTAVMEILLNNQEQWFVSCFKSNFSLVPCRSAS